jgi:hypothetical protein
MNSHRKQRSTALSLSRLTILLLTGLAARAPAATVTIEDVAFPRAITVGDQSFELHGVGLMRYRRLFRAYVAALYLGSGHGIEDLDQPSTPVRLELAYFWPVAGTAFAPFAQPYLEKNLTPETLERIADRVDTLNAWYRDVAPGDRYALTHRPGVGTELAFNGRRLGIVPGDDFGPAYLRIWLGSEPVNARLREQLLERR